MDTNRASTEKTNEPETAKLETAKKKKPYDTPRLVRLQPGSRQESAAKIELAGAIRKRQRISLNVGCATSSFGDQQFPMK